MGGRERLARRARDLGHRGGPRAPRVVIDERGREVAVLVDYRRYVDLLQTIADEVGDGRLSSYWRRALDDSLLARPGSARRR